jgi:hypothetical protein
MKFSFCLFACFLLTSSVYSFAFTLNKVNFSDTTVVIASNKEKTKEVKLINNDTPIIIQKGDKLTIKVSNEDNRPATVRLHSSLGRLVQQYPEVWDKITMSTDKLLPGVYLVIIKKDETREIRKVLLTE